MGPAAQIIYSLPMQQDLLECAEHVAQVGMRCRPDASSGPIIRTRDRPCAHPERTTRPVARDGNAGSTG
jgi:hypothetical protein